MVTKAKSTTKATRNSVGKPPVFADYFTAAEQSRHIKGAACRNIYVENVESFFRDFKHHTYIFGQPGVGKTYLVEKMAAKYSSNIFLLTIKGNMTLWGFIKTMAVAMYSLPKHMKLAVYIEDMNTLFKGDGAFLDHFKIALDKKSGDRLEYNVSLGAQYNSCEEHEKKAIDYFKELTPGKTGFIIPFDNRVRFIFTMNTPLPGKQEMATVQPGSDKWIKLNNRAAIRSRTNYVDLLMDKETFWGWLAEVVWNSPDSMCVGATTEQRYEILVWLWENWANVSETSLRFIEEKMWDTMKSYPARAAYRHRWTLL
jgi:hypothetical protein